MYGFSSATSAARLEDGDRFDLDQPLRHGERRHRHQGGRARLLAEELLADRSQVGAMADVGEVGVDLDDVVHRAAARLDLGLDRLEDGAGLRLEVPAVRGPALVVVAALAREVENGLGSGDLHGLRVGRRIPDTLGGVALDLDHAISSDREWAADG